MKNQQQIKHSQSLVASSVIKLLFFITALFYSKHSTAQVFDSVNFHLNLSCNSGGTNAGDLPLTVCQNETVLLHGLYDVLLNGHDITWTDISSQLLPAATDSTSITTTFVLAPDTALDAAITFTAPGVYLFRLSAHCRNTILSIGIEGDTIFATLDDTVRITVLPIPTANAGRDSLYCSFASGFWTAPLNATPAGINQLGAWSYAGSTYSTEIAAFGDPSDPNATFSVSGQIGIYNLFWTVTDTITECSDRDTVQVLIPAEQPVWANSAVVCGNAHEMLVNHTNSYMGYFSEWLPYTTAFEGNDSVFFTYYQTGGPDTATITNAFNGNVWFSVDSAGLYTFTYWVHGFCINDSVTFTIQFNSGSPMTHVKSPTAFPVCDSTATFTFTNVLPNLSWGETSWWEVTSGLTILDPVTNNQDTIHVTWDGVSSLPQYVFFYLANADSSCIDTVKNFIYATYPYNIVTMDDTTLLCGSSYCHFNYTVISNGAVEYPFGGDPLIIISQPAGASATVINAYVYAPPYPTPSYLFPGTIDNMTIPGVYKVLIRIWDRCYNYYTDTISFTIDQPPSGANAGNEIILLCGQNVTELQANIPVVGIGSWSVFDDGLGFVGLPVAHPYYSSPSLYVPNYFTPNSGDTPDPTVGGFTETGFYYFEWVVCNPNCPAPTPDQCYHNTVSVYAPDSTGNTAIAGNDTVLCDTSSFHLYTLGVQNLPGTWSQLASNPDSVTISNIHTDSPFIFGFNTSGIYGFVWSLPAGCGNLSDTMYVTYQPENCCMAANNPVYHQWVGDTTITQNFVMSGKYYIDGIVTVSNNAILDITNVDLVFSTCSGVNFESGTSIRANNSVLRPCNIQDSWRGLAFADSTFGVIENSIFKNAIYGIDLWQGKNTIRIFNNTFSNNHIAINADQTVLMEAITGNTFTIDNSFVDFYKGLCALPDTFDLNYFELPGYIANYGIMANITNFEGLISQNNFINGSDPEKNHLFYGIEGNKIIAKIANNTFTNMFRSVDIGNSIGVSIFNNKIDIAVSGESILEDFQHHIQIRVTQSDFCKINNNKVTSSFLIGEEKITLISFGSLIYIEGNQNTEISNNELDGGITSISAFNCNDTYINSNVIKRAFYAGIYAFASKRTDITCNEIFMSTITEGYSGEAITINDYEIELPNKTSQIRNNCVFDANTAITIYGADCSYKIPNVFNNFLYNYSYTGIFVNGAGNIGTDILPGRNTFISNNIGNGAVDVVNGVICPIYLAGNYGVNNYQGNVTIINQNPFNSSASCANQITEFPDYEFNNNLDMSELTACAPYLFANDSLFKDTAGVIILANSFTEQLATFNANEVLLKSAGLIKLLASYNRQNDINTVYNLVNLSGKLNAQQTNWFNYYYNFAKQDYQTALNNLNAINYTNENEKHLLKLETIKTNMQLNQILPKQLNSATINELKSIVDLKVVCSPMASDLLKLAIDGYDYPFQPIVLKTHEHDKTIKLLAANQVAVWPNPATDNVTIDFVLQGKTNGQLYLYDVNGNMILQKTLPYQAGKTSLNIQNLATGMYLLMIKQDDKIVHQSKLIKK